MKRRNVPIKSLEAYGEILVQYVIKYLYVFIVRQSGIYNNSFSIIILSLIIILLLDYNTISTIIIILSSIIIPTMVKYNTTVESQLP